MTRCRACGHEHLERVLDLGAVPPADHFPPADSSPSAAESTHELAMDMCAGCGLAQLADDDTVPDEPRGIELEALREQARKAVEAVEKSGRLQGRTVIEFGSPHGGTWLPLLLERGVHPASPGTPASLVLDCFGIMHEADQRGAFLTRAASLAPDGLLLLQFHTLSAIVSQGQWNALRHGHYAYYSLTALRRLLEDVGLHIAEAWTFELYGGTVLVAAQQDPWTNAGLSARRLLAAERTTDITNPATVRTLQRQADRQADELATWLREMAAENRCVFAYGAASRAVALFARAGIDRSLVYAVADGSPAKAGRRMPGTDIPIVDLDTLRHMSPDCILLTVPELLSEVRSQFPQFDGRWFLPSDSRNGVRQVG
ncbi:class I SAM-dependent methyltransferase [Rhodococcus sp. NPDC047139]|uniref:class I SAM-dependent methyltransferase n=1 Tax=Rhodococcus sp. NPDC047139 TaxID=3155141 RepID=UPI0033F443DB